MFLTHALVAGDTVHVTQSLTSCPASVARQLTVACVDPPVSGDPSALDLFPVGFTEYAAGPVRGSVYYPAVDDGKDMAFNQRLAALGRVPLVVLAHGNHSPADPSYRGGYDYFQTALAKMGIVAVSVDCNALNGSGAGVGNIEARADLIIDSIRHFQALDATPGLAVRGPARFRPGRTDGGALPRRGGRGGHRARGDGVDRRHDPVGAGARADQLPLLGGPVDDRAERLRVRDHPAGRRR